MNYRMILNLIGNILRFLALLLLLPLIISFANKENIYLAYLIPIILLTILSFLLKIKKPQNKQIYIREGFIITALSWLLLSLFGSLPFIISKEIPYFFDAFFETVSGFTTTGSSILNNVEEMSTSLVFWRSLTQWIGGMGILVFALAILPSTDARSMYIIKAESPGPQVGKLVSRVRFTARILYGIYIGLTLILFILLSFKMPVFDSLCHALSTASTGGFGIKNTSIAFYDSFYIEIVISIFMILFGINFNIFYLILIGHLKEALKSEELRVYFSIVIIATILIAFNLINSGTYNSVGTAFRYSFFQTSSIITTTGFSTADFNLWPSFSKWILVLLMFSGGMAGSTAGGIKISRIVIQTKIILKEIKYSINPRRVTTLTFENKPLEPGVIKGASSFILVYMLLLFGGVLLISLDGKDLLTNFTASLSCLSNIGPGLEIIGPLGNYSSFSNFSKLILSILMLAGRLEIFPILILFSPNTWKR
ncbi:MAG: TrkH family potassium uptake protein [Bacilli bacterium]|jgi:trk system potassium uptake protein TrkH